MSIKIVDFEMSQHFKRRLKERFPGTFQDITKNSKWLCTRNDRSLHICKFKKKAFALHANNKEKILITIYEVDPKTLFRDFMRLYITKPQQLKHQFRDKKTWGSLFIRINNKLKHKLKKYAKGVFVEELNSFKTKNSCRYVFAQIVFDYLDFYVRYLNENFTKESFKKYIKANSLVINRTEEREITAIEFLEDKFTDEQLVRFYES